MRILIMLNVLIIVLFASCDKDTNSQKSNAEIINFNAEKCRCCWGWTIKMGNDTIKSDNIIIGETIGYEITNPVKVYIELGEIEDNCSNFSYTNPNLKRDYYQIKKIEKIE